jgi:hypothetical protein
MSRFTVVAASRVVFRLGAGGGLYGTLSFAPASCNIEITGRLPNFLV